jgi:mannan endo-1,4-beta-mannosidase
VLLRMTARLQAVLPGKRSASEHGRPRAMATWSSKVSLRGGTIRTRHKDRWRHQSVEHRTSVRVRRVLLVALVGVVAAVLAIGSADVLGARTPALGAHRSQVNESTNMMAGHNKLPVTRRFYLGVYVPGVPRSYNGLTLFTKATGVRPNLVSYYSGWMEPFSSSFAALAAEHDAVPLVQINPSGVSVAAIASGTYDGYLRSYAKSVRSHRGPVILSFGHEMNGQWYPWGYKHTAADVFVAAWRHIVDVFRGVRANNVTWMWTVNTIEPRGGQIPNPISWWPGSSYVNWIGVDGYFHKASAQFSSVFGPTISDLREFTRDPILISETGAAPQAKQPTKIEGLFKGVHLYGLLGFIWFDAIGNADYRVDSLASNAAFRRGAKAYGS